MNNYLLLEIGTEEMPASQINSAERQFKEKMQELLKENEIDYEEIKSYSTPRRLAIVIKGIAEKQKDKEIEVYGPPKSAIFNDFGEFTPQAIGFARAHNIETNEIKIKIKGKKEVAYFIKKLEGKFTTQIIKENLKEIIKGIEFNKTMRWNETKFRFCRPIRWIVALFNDKIIPIEIGGVKSSNITYGLRFTLPIIIDNASLYEEKLSNEIILEYDKRVERIKIEIERISKEIGAIPKYEHELLEEVANLTEHPVAILCRFDEKFLSLPKEIIISALTLHQRYFPLEYPNGEISPYFVVIANIKDGDIDGIKEINNMVVNARLSDAKFYYEEDLKISFKDREKELKSIIFDERLGTLYDKIERIKKLCEYLSKFIYVDFPSLMTAASYCKNDLTTNMIKDGKEYTKLEGIYGGLLADKQNFDKKIVNAIKLHKFTPTIDETKEGVVLALADKIDDIIGAFVAGKVPTGSKDPYGIRRLGNEFIKIIIENKLVIKLKELIKVCINNFSLHYDISSIFSFLQQRIDKYMSDSGIEKGIIDSVVTTDIDDAYDLFLRAKAISNLDKDKLQKIITAQKRLKNIVNENKYEINKELLKDEVEIMLYERLASDENKFNEFILNKNYDEAIEYLYNLSPLIDNLFDKVLIMAEDKEIRYNRLGLINYINSFFNKIANFSKITT